MAGIGSGQMGQYQMIEDDILETYNNFVLREGCVPNELHIPDNRRDEFHNLVSQICSVFKGDPFNSIEQLWYMDMRVVYDVYSFAVACS